MPAQIGWIAAAAAAGMFLGFWIPRFAERAVSYKCSQRGKETPPFYLPRGTRLATILVNGLVFALAVFWMPPLESAFVCFFSVIAWTGAIIDYEIRIIPNELVALLLPVGLAYRVAVGGFASLPGALLAFAFTAALFGLVAFLSYHKKGVVGIGAGDLKLSAVIALAVGWPGVQYFLLVFSLTILVYCMIGMTMGVLTKATYFPMCLYIMTGFVGALFSPYLEPLLLGA